MSLVFHKNLHQINYFTIFVTPMRGTPAFPRNLNALVANGKSTKVRAVKFRSNKMLQFLSDCLP